jgi:hypothetical protein
MQKSIVSGYARMWPREVFLRVRPLKATSKRKKMIAKGLSFLEGSGVLRSLSRRPTTLHRAGDETAPPTLAARDKSGKSLLPLLELLFGVRRSKSEPQGRT